MRTRPFVRTALLSIVLALVILWCGVGAAFAFTGNVLESFETGTVGWTNFQGTGALTDDTAHVLDGAHALRLTTPPTGGAVGAQKLLAQPVDLSADQQIRIYYYVWDDDPGKYLTQCDIRLATTPDFANAFNVTPTLAYVHQGWNVLVLNQADFTAMGSPSWSSPIVGVKIKVASAAAPLSVSFDSIWTGCAGKAAVSFVFDDGWSSVYTEAYSYMAAKGLVGAVGVVPPLVGEPQRCTLPQLQEMYAAGWDMLNHTYDHLDLTAMTSEEVAATIAAASAYLVDNGMPRGAYDVVYPMGAYDQGVIDASTGSGARSGSTTYPRFEALPLVDTMALRRSFLYHTTTLAEAKGWVDAARARGAYVIISAHSLVEGEPGVNQWRISDFRALVDHVVASGVEVVPYTAVLGDHRLSYAAGAGGTIAGGATQSVRYGGSGSEVSAVAATGHRFTSWSDGLTSATRRDTLVTRDLSVTANFVPYTYTITATAGANGTVTPSSISVTHGSSATVTITPVPGYRVADVKVDGASVGAVTSYTFSSVTSDHVVTATFAPAATRYEQSHPYVSYEDDWSTLYRSTCSGGSLRYSTDDDCYVTIRFRGTGISYITSKDRNYGIARVTLDRNTPVNVDLYSYTRQDQVKAWGVTGLPYGDHTLRIAYSDMKNRNSGGYRVALDAVDVEGSLLSGYSSYSSWWWSGDREHDH